MARTFVSVFKVSARSIGKAQTDSRHVNASHARTAKPLFLKQQSDLSLCVKGLTFTVFKMDHTNVSACLAHTALST